MRFCPAALITAASNIINDYFDIEIDRVNKPERPLPSGIVSLRSALVLSLVLYGLGMACGAMINVTAFVISALSSVLLYVYSARLKRTVLFGNLTVSLATGMAFIYGGVAVGNIRNATVPAIFAFLMHFGREIIKDMEDVEGDRQDHAITLPVRFGLMPARHLVTWILGLLILVTIVPYLMELYGIWYLLIVMAGVNTILLYSVVMVWARPDKAVFGRLSALLKSDMLVGLLAIYAGRW